MLPGLLSWVVLAGVEIIVSPRASLISSGTIAAFVLVSTLPWATTVKLPRFAAGIGWLVWLAMFATVFQPAAGPSAFSAVGQGRSWIEAAAVLLLYPPLLVGETLAGPLILLTLPALLLAAVSMAWAFATIQREDIPLEAAQ